MLRVLGLRFFSHVVITAALAIAITSPAAAATLTSVGPGFFSGIDVDYGPVSTGQPVNGNTYGGVLHHFSIAGNPSLDAIIDAGPGNTNNITVANIEGNTAGILSLTFTGLKQAMGFGFAENIPGTYASAVSVELFDSANVSLGSLAGGSAPDPTFTGGFFGVHSSVDFSRAQVRFIVPNASRFAFDNLRFKSAAVPETTSIVLLAAGLLSLGALMRRR